MRISGHDSTARFDSRNAPKVTLPDVNIGDRVFIKSDKLKNKARDPYLVLSHVPNKAEINVQKIVDEHNRRNVLSVQLQNVYKPSPFPENPQLPQTSPHQLCETSGKNALENITKP